MKTGKNFFLYLFFFLLFSPDTWRVLIGLLAALIVGPRATAGGDYSPAGRAVVWLMILAIFYVLSAPVGRSISRRMTALFKSQGSETAKRIKNTKKNG